MFIKSDGALVRAKSVFNHGQNEVRVIVINILAIVLLCRLLLVLPQNEDSGCGVGEVRATYKVMLIRYPPLALRALSLANVVNNNNGYLVVSSGGGELLYQALLNLKITARVNLHQTVKQEHVATKQALGVNDETDGFINRHDI